MQPFKDFGFKLVVLEALLENGSFKNELQALKSRPEIACRISGNEAYGEKIPEMEAFFRNVEFTQEDLNKVEELCFDGGNDIYHLIIPFWSGYSDDFDVLSVDGFEALTNLKSVLHISMVSDEQVARLADAGIEIE